MCKENSPTNVNSPAVVDVKNSNNNETRKLLHRQIWIPAILADILKQRDEVLMGCLVEIVNLKRERHSAEAIDSNYELNHEVMERKQQVSEPLVHDLTFTMKNKMAEKELVKVIKSNVKLSLASLFSQFVILEKKPNILYLNTCVRAYPKGLRADSDPRKPITSIDEYFEKIGIKRINQVWGCGDKTSCEVQLDIKKRQMKKVDGQRTVKLTAADWMDHPDRFLLELGGR
uniref:Uncharacterized protein n=1 Tax=Glossina morsitans morsitans TaxID=37546 RepID=A0A1B0FH94_GLOMM